MRHGKKRFNSDLGKSIGEDVVGRKRKKYEAWAKENGYDKACGGWKGVESRAPLK